MKCIPLYCNIAHELKGTGMEAKGTYNQVYVRRRKKTGIHYVWTKHKTYLTATSWGFLLPQIIRICRLTFLDTWNMASSLKTLLAAKCSFSSSLEKSQEKM
jgi:hypothetical protein